MIHAFDPDIAKEVGIEAAVLYQNIQYWCEKNRLNDQNFFEDTYWTYNSIKAFCEMFPYMSKDMISRNLSKLEKKGYIKKGNFNKVGFDRTLWYADLLPFPKNAKCISEKCEIDFAQERNGFSENAKPIPNINTNINTDRKKERKTSFDDILDSQLITEEDKPELRATFIDFIKMRKNMKKPLTDRGLELIIKDTIKLADGNTDLMKQIVEQSIKRGWLGVFPLKDEKRSFSRAGTTGADAGIHYVGTEDKKQEEAESDFFEIFGEE